MIKSVFLVKFQSFGSESDFESYMPLIMNA